MKTRDLILPLLLSLPTSAWASEDEQQQPPGLPAEVVLLKAQPLTPVIQAVGNLQANESVIIRPEQSGQIRKILFLEGQAVKAGELMFQLDTALYDAALAQSKARVSLSQQEYQRAQSLLQRKVGSQNDRDAALAQLRVDKAEVSLAQTRIDKMNLRAPFAGIAGLRQVSPCDYVSTGQDLAIAFGAGAESRQQIGWVIVGGMTFGTLLTLFVIPTVYSFLGKRTFRVLAPQSHL